MITVCGSHSLPIQGANAVWQHHCLRRAPRMLVIKNTKCVLPSTFLLILCRVSIFAQQMRHSPGRTESSLVPAWLLSPCGVRQPLLTYLFLPLHFGGHSHLRSGVRAKLQDRLALKRCVLCLNPKMGLWPGFQS